jgi:hypothetical protein
MRVCIASCVRRSSLASFLSISRLRSQFARFGAILSKSCWPISSPPSGHVLAERGTHEVLRLALTVLGDRARRDARNRGLDRVFLVARALPERARLRVEVTRELGRRGRVVPARTLSTAGLVPAAGDALTRRRRARRRGAGAAQVGAAYGARTRLRATQVEGQGLPSSQVNVAVVPERVEEAPGAVMSTQHWETAEMGRRSPSFFAPSFIRSPPVLQPARPIVRTTLVSGITLKKSAKRVLLPALSFSRPSLLVGRPVLWRYR